MHDYSDTNFGDSNSTNYEFNSFFRYQKISFMSRYVKDEI